TPNIVIQPLILVALTLARTCAVTNASPQPMKMPCTTSFRTVLAWLQNPWMKNQTHTAPMSAVRNVVALLYILFEVAFSSFLHQKSIRRRSSCRNTRSAELQDELVTTLFARADVPPVSNQILACANAKVQSTHWPIRLAVDHLEPVGRQRLRAR